MNEPTFNTKAIILSRYDFREADSRIICYSSDRGKLELVARGAKKLKSKSSGHLEPLTLSRLMVVVGKDFNYAGTAVGENFYPAIKNNLEKITLAGQAMALVEKMTRVGEVGGHEEIFNLLKNFLDELEKNTNKNSAVIPAPAFARAGSGGIQIKNASANFLDSRHSLSSVKTGDGNDDSIKVFSQELSAILGFSQEDFEELRQK